MRSPAPAVRIPLVSEAPRAKSTPTNGATSESLIWSPASTESAFRQPDSRPRSGHRSRCRARSGWCWLEVTLATRVQFTIEPQRREESNIINRTAEALRWVEFTSRPNKKTRLSSCDMSLKVYF